MPLWSINIPTCNRQTQHSPLFFRHTETQTRNWASGQTVASDVWAYLYFKSQSVKATLPWLNRFFVLLTLWCITGTFFGLDKETLIGKVKKKFFLLLSRHFNYFLSKWSFIIGANAYALKHPYCYSPNYFPFLSFLQICGCKTVAINVMIVQSGLS